MSGETGPGRQSGRLAERLRARLRLSRRYAPAIARNIRRFGAAIRLLPSLVLKPALLLLWLRSARRAHLAFLASIFLLTVVAPPTYRMLADELYPPLVQERTVLIFLKRDQVTADPAGDRLYATLMTASWALGMTFVSIVLVGHIPAAVALGRRRARAVSAASAARTDTSDIARPHAAADALPLDRADVGGARPGDSASRGRDVARTALIAPTKPEKKEYIGAAGRYRLDKVLGSGGMGVVHAGYDTVLKRPVALKQLFGHLVNDPEHSQRFRQEATALAALTHNHIVGIYDLVEDAGCFWIVMELLTGGSLGDRLSDRGPLAVAPSVDITCKIADALGYAHGQGMVHRDVKPMNILFTSTGTPKLADFGNAKVAVPSVHTQHGVTLGSPVYMSPEQAAGETVDRRSDIYSLGISLYHMLTGEVPFDGDFAAILAKHIGETPRAPNELNSEVGDELAAVVLTMIEKKPEDRFQNAADLVPALRQSIRIAEAG